MISLRNKSSQTEYHAIRLRKYLIPFALLALSVVVLMAGCQFGDLLTQVGSPTVANKGNQSLDTTATFQASPTTVKTLQPKTLVIWLPPQLDPNNGSLAAGILQDRLASFVKKHPQYTIEIRIKSTDGQSSLLDALESTSEVAPAALPALIALPYPSMDAAVQDGRLLSIGTSAGKLDDPDWLPYARKSAQINGQVYGIPFGGDVLVLAYHHLIESTIPPVTWNELIDRGGIVAFPAGEPSAVVISQIYLSAGGHLTDSNGKPLIEKDPLHVTIKLLSDGAQEGVFPYWLTNITSFDQSWQSFLGQQSQYAIIWSSQYLQSLPQGIDIAPTPTVGDQSISLVKPWIWCIPSSSPVERQDSMLLLQYLSDPDFINRWSQAAGLLPVRESGLESWKSILDSQLVTQLRRENLLIPLSSSNPSTSPLLADAVMKIIKNQVSVDQLEDDIISQFQVK